MIVDLGMTLFSCEERGKLAGNEEIKALAAYLDGISFVERGLVLVW